MQFLLYAGPGGGAFSLSAVRRDIRRAGKHSVSVSASFLQTRHWGGPGRTLIVPGGADVPMRRALGGDGLKRIRAHVEAGGQYIGICAGAYMAAETVEWRCDPAFSGSRELAFFPGTAAGPLKFGQGTFTPDFGGVCRVRVRCGRHLYSVWYHGGPAFIGADNVTVLARYMDLPGQPPAAVECCVGRGRARIFGFHPEMPGGSAFPFAPKYRGGTGFKKVFFG